MNTGGISRDRIEAVYQAIQSGAITLTAIIKITRFSHSSCYHATKALIAEKRIEHFGNRSGGEGNPAHLFRLAVKQTKSQANGVKHYANAGIAQEIRHALKAGPMTVSQIAQRIDREPDRVRKALGTLINVTGGVISSGPHTDKIYQLFTPKPKQERRPDRPYQWPERPTIPQFRWGGTRLSW